MPVSPRGHKQPEKERIKCQQNAGEDNRLPVTDHQLSKPVHLLQGDHPEGGELHALVADVLFQCGDILRIHTAVFCELGVEKLQQHRRSLCLIRLFQCVGSRLRYLCLPVQQSREKGETEGVPLTFRHGSKRLFHRGRYLWPVHLIGAIEQAMQ